MFPAVNNQRNENAAINGTATLKLLATAHQVQKIRNFIEHLCRNTEEDGQPAACSQAKNLTPSLDFKGDWGEYK